MRSERQTSGCVKCRYLSLVTELRLAIERHELCLHYQPQIAAASGAVVGAEALMRWFSPSRGLVPPCDFIPVAEQSGLIQPMGEWVVDMVCQRLDFQRGRPHPGGPLSIAMNISPAELESRRPARAIRSAMRRYALTPSLLEVEITESVALAELDNQCLREIADLGVRLAIDDFGAGYSNLGKLARLPIHTLKLDRSLVSQVAASSRDRCIVRTIIDMAHELDLRVVAEGVETPEQMSVLRSYHCDIVQGFAIAPPMDADAFAKWLETAASRISPAEYEAVAS